MATLRTLLCLILPVAGLAQRPIEHPHYRNALPFAITPHPLDHHLRPRQTGAPANPGPSICGYRNGNLDRGWKAPEGSTCFLDTTASYFGFCNVLFTKSTDCTDVPRACVDSSTCSNGCGKTNDPNMHTLTCTKASSYCYSNLLVTGDLTYTALGCDLSRAPLIYSPAAGILNAPTGTPATPTASTPTASTSPAGSSGSSSEALAFTPQATGSISATSDTSGQTLFGTATFSGTPSATSSSTPAASGSSNAGAIAGGTVGGLAVVAIAGLAFYFIKRRSPKSDPAHQEPAELGSPAYQHSSAEKFAYNTELPADIAAAELPLNRDPVELHADEPSQKAVTARNYIS